MTKAGKKDIKEKEAATTKKKIGKNKKDEAAKKTYLSGRA